MTLQLPEHLQRLATDLDRAWPQRNTRRAGFARHVARRRTRLLAIALLVAVALIFVLARSDRGPGSIDRALAAVGQQPANVIVHWVSTDYAPDGSLADRQEVWGASSPPYGQRSIVLNQPGRPPVEQSRQGDAITQFDPAANILFVRSVPGGTLEANSATRIGADPARVTHFLRADSTRDLGIVSVNGREVHRFVLTPDGGGTCSYDVDPNTYYGLGFACHGLASGAGIQTWEYLPRTPETSKLLSVAAQHPDARTDQAPIGPCTTPDQYQDASMAPCSATATRGG